GYNPYTEAQLFADVGVGYRPDLVLVEFCINDLNDPTLHFDASTMASLGALPEAAFPDPGGRRPAAGPAARLCRRLRTCPRRAAPLHRPLAPERGRSPRRCGRARRRAGRARVGPVVPPYLFGRHSTDPAVNDCSR